jgi:stage II sporulation protein D
MRYKTRWGISLILIISCVFLIFHSIAAQEPKLVRILLASGQAELNIAANGGAPTLNDLSSGTAQPVSFAAAENLQFTVAAEAINLNGVVLGKGPFSLTSPSALLGWGGRKYRGELLISFQSTRLNLINRLIVEEYLRGVVPREISPNWVTAAVRAQVIAARTYTIASLNRHATSGADLCATTHCQVYGGASAEHPLSDKAILDTAGLVITYNGKPINAFYHDSSGGYTEDVANVWNTSVPYLKPVPDWDFKSPRTEWTKVLEWNDLQGIVARTYPAIGRLNQLLPASFGYDGKILKVKLKGDTGETSITGEQFRYITGIPSSTMKFGLVYGPEPYVLLWWLSGKPQPDVLMTSNDVPGVPVVVLNPPWELPDPWSWLQDKEPWRLVVKGSGWGHGVGLSQWGAKGMAEAGYNETQILLYYYPGTAIVKWEM